MNGDSGAHGRSQQNQRLLPCAAANTCLDRRRRCRRCSRRMRRETCSLPVFSTTAPKHAASAGGRRCAVAQHTRPAHSLPALCSRSIVIAAAVAAAALCADGSRTSQPSRDVRRQLPTAPSAWLSSRPLSVVSNGAIHAWRRCSPHDSIWLLCPATHLTALRRLALSADLVAAAAARPPPCCL